MIAMILRVSSLPSIALSRWWIVLCLAACLLIMADWRPNRRMVIAVTCAVLMLSVTSYAVVYMPVDACELAPNWLYILLGCWIPQP
jgi:hypothetical protein